MGFFGKNKSFQINGLEGCRVAINGMDISAFIDHKQVKSLMYDGSDIYANDICISRYLKDEIAYTVKVERPTETVKTTSKSSSKNSSSKIDLTKVAEAIADNTTVGESPFSLENLHIEIIGSVESIESEGNLSIKAETVENVDCESNLTITAKNIEGNVSADGSLTINGDVNGDVNGEETILVSGNVEGSVSSGESLTVKGNVTTNDGISVDDKLTIGGNVEADSISVADTFEVSGDVTIRGGIDVEGDVHIKGSFNGETINAEGGVTITK